MSLRAVGEQAHQRLVVAKQLQVVGERREDLTVDGDLIPDHFFDQVEGAEEIMGHIGHWSLIRLVRYPGHVVGIPRVADQVVDAVKIVWISLVKVSPCRHRTISQEVVRIVIPRYQRGVTIRPGQLLTLSGVFDGFHVIQ